MAKIYTDIKTDSNEKKEKDSWFQLDLFFEKAYLIWFLVFVIVCLFISHNIEIEKKKVNNIKMELVKKVENDNNNILTSKVKYSTSVKVDKNDTSDIFFEVVNGNEKNEVGDLIKFNHRFIQEVELEGKTYCVIDASQVLFRLKVKDVDQTIIKRE